MAESWYDVGPQSSYPGVPAPAGMNDWREDGRLPSRAETEKCSAGACPQLGVGGRQPASAIETKANGAHPPTRWSQNPARGSETCLW